MNIPNGLPILSRGSHDRASGKACIMNAISYLNGDIDISDAPDCVAEPLRSLFIQINDRICYGTPEAAYPSADELCPKCSHVMWLYGTRLIGTAGAYKALSHDERKLMAYEMSRVLIKTFSSSEKDARLAHLQNMIDRGTSVDLIISDIGDKITRHLLELATVDPTGDLRIKLATQIMKAALQVFDYHTTSRASAAEGPTDEQFKKVADEAKVTVYAA